MEKQLLKRISSLEKRVVDLYHKLKQQLVGPQGPQGVEGPQGPQGALGPVGPAGLEWQGLWNEDTSYAQDDAVGYAGASWFCISAVTGTNNDSPDNDTEHWALLAAQGAQGQDGAPGAQGPIGPQGPAGNSILKSIQLEVTQAEILNGLGFSKSILPSISGKVLVPVSIILYRKAGGTNYTIANSVRLVSNGSAGSSSLGSITFDTVFQNSFQSTSIFSLGTNSSVLVTGNSLHLTSGSFTSPSVITGGTGNLVLCLTYIEVTP